MKRLLIISDEKTDMTETLSSCPISTEIKSFSEALTEDLSAFDCFYMSCNGMMDARLRSRLETECKKGKNCLLESPNSWMDVYSADPVTTLRARLACVSDSIPELKIGDILDDESNMMMCPYCTMKNTRPLLVYHNYIIAHKHWNASLEELMKDSMLGLWQIGDNTIMSSFKFRWFRRARFAPIKHWEILIGFLAEWLTGSKPVKFPEFGVSCRKWNSDLSDDVEFETARKESVRKGIGCLRNYLVDNGMGGVREGLRHDILSDGTQLPAEPIRTDCSGETSGAFRFFAKTENCEQAKETADNLQNFIFDPMQIKGGIFDGMLRWTNQAWTVCYQDDVARAILPALYDCILFHNDRHFPEITKALEFLVKTTAKDGTRRGRTDCINMDENSFSQLTSEEHGYHSAHYNAYYLAALLLAYQYGKNKLFLDTAVKGMETLMALYPDEITREQSETEEMCRLILPLAILYETTGLEKHKEMLYRVTEDLKRVQHPCGGFSEWDTGYKANCSRMSRGECSVLTENGDPVADLLYSTNWLPMAFAWAYRATGDEQYKKLWKDVVRFCIRSQISCNDPKVDGCWCRAFDMESGEVYAAPHDAGWGPCATETGWTDAEILMGMMIMDIFESGKN